MHDASLTRLNPGSHMIEYMATSGAAEDHIEKCNEPSTLHGRTDGIQVSKGVSTNGICFDHMLATDVGLN